MITIVTNIFQLVYIFGNTKYTFEWHIFFQTAFAFSISIYFSNKTRIFIQYNFFPSDHLISVTIHALKLKHVFFLLKCSLNNSNRRSYFLLAVKYSTKFKCISQMP